MSEEYWDSLAQIRKQLKSALSSIDALLAMRPVLPARETFDDRIVRQIRQRFRDNGESVTKLALEFGVSKSTISRAVRYQTHKTK